MEIKVNAYNNNPIFMANTYKTLTDKMIPVLREAINNGETVTSEQLAQKIGATKNVVRRILYHGKDSTARSLFDQVKSPKGTKKVVSDETIAGYRAAMTAAARAGISSKKKKAKTHVRADYATYLAQTITDMKLTEDTEKILTRYIAQSPLFVDFLINNKDKNNNRRRLTTGNINKMYVAYNNNSELTEQLSNTHDDDGNFKYSTEQIWRLINIHKICPDLYETAKEAPDFVYDVYNMKDENEKPRFGVQEIKLLTEKHSKFPKYTDYLLAETDISGRPRFNTEQITFILNELEGEHPEFVVDLVKFKEDIYTEKSDDYVTSLPQTVKLSGDNIKDIINMDKKYKVQGFVYKLMSVVNKYNITGKKFVRCTELSTKSNVEFVKGLKYESQLGNDKYSLLEVAGRKLTKEEFEELKNMKSEQKPLVYTIGTEQQEPLFDKYELKQLKEYVEK